MRNLQKLDSQLSSRSQYLGFTLGLRTPNGHAVDLSTTITIWIVAMDDHIIVRFAIECCYPLDGAVDLVFVSSGCVRTHVCSNTESALILKGKDHEMSL
jgi:hypothetical protein